MSSAVTYSQLHSLLRRLDFAELPTRDNFRAFHHSASDTLIVLANRTRVRRAGPTDVASVRRHLVEKGILDQDAFDQFIQQGQLPG